MAHFPPALHAILTCNSIIKLGCNIKQALLDIALAYNDLEIKLSLQSNPAILELGQHAKLKGFVCEGSASLHALVGKLLNKCFNPLTSSNTWGSACYAQQLHTHVESIWQVYLCLNANVSVGLPLVKVQAETNVHLVALFQASIPVAEGHIIWPWPNFIEVIKDAADNRHWIKITPSCSLILITKVLRPNSIHQRHGQCLSWIFDHEKQAVVTTSTLRTRGAVTPIPSESISDTSIATVPCVNLMEPFTLSIPADSGSFPQIIDQDCDIDDREDNNLDLDRRGEDDEEHIDMSNIGHPAVSDHLRISYVMPLTELLQHHDVVTMPLRVLDDPFHFMDCILRLLPKMHSAFDAFFMDCILRLLPKMHSAFDAFCGEFSKAIFLTDKDDEANV